MLFRKHLGFSGYPLALMLITSTILSILRNRCFLAAKHAIPAMEKVNPESGKLTSGGSIIFTSSCTCIYILRLSFNTMLNPILHVSGRLKGRGEGSRMWVFERSSGDLPLILLFVSQLDCASKAA